MKSMKDKIPKKKKANKSKPAKKRGKVSRRAILEDSSDKDNFANEQEVAPVVNSAGTVPSEIIVSKNSYCTDKSNSMLKTNENTTNYTDNSTINENKEIETPIECAEKHLFDTESVDLETVTTDDSTLDSGTAGNAFSRRDVEIHEEDQEVSYMIPVPKTGKPRDTSLTPITIMVLNTIELKKSRKLLKVLLDPGSTSTMIHKDVIPRGCKPVSLQSSKNMKT